VSKLPTISVSEWLQAEEEFRQESMPPQPKGSVTSEQYSNMLGCASSTGRLRLKAMFAAGKVTRERWKCGINSYCYVYWIKK
jgi:hypothetical protein